MTSDLDGHWSLAVESAHAGSRYWFVIDGIAYADPRSKWQPEGVNGPSALIDHKAFRWHDLDWRSPSWKSAVVYELHLGTFSREGTYAGAIPHLDHLVEMGVTHVELMPVNEFSGDHGWGYDGVNLFAPHHCYGTPDDLKHLVETCHLKGLAVVLDVVYNHLGPIGNSLGKFAPYFTQHYTTPWGPAINLDQAGCDQVRRFVCDNALMWLRDYHFDGLRMDAVHAFFDTSPRHILEQLADEVTTLEAHVGRNLVLIAESDLNDPRVVKDRAVGGYGVTAQWSDDFHHSLHAVLTGEIEGYYKDFGKIAHIAKTLHEVWVYDGCYSDHRKRPHGRRATGLRGWSFLGYSQNHDQVGNRARGDRLSHSTGTGKAKIAAALVLTGPFVPMIFQGEEWGATTPFLYFSDHREDWMATAVSQGRKSEFAAFGWPEEDVPDPQDLQSFRSSKLCWTELGDAEHADLLAWYQTLIRLRRERSELTDGDFGKVQVKFDEDERWLRVKRGRIEAAYNFGTEPCAVQLCRLSKVLLASREPTFSGERLTLPPESVTILESE